MRVVFSPASSLDDVAPLSGAGSAPYGACSDGLNFWLGLRSIGQLARF